jgi:hypothetical protein
MDSTVELTVNKVPIVTINFVKTFVEHTVVGMLAGLRDTGEVADLDLEIKNEAVGILINGRDIPLNEFATKIIISTLEGLLKPCKGVTLPIQELQLHIKRS